MTDEADDITLREPEPEDAAALWELAKQIGLDLNSPYAYLLVSRHLAPTSIVAELNEQIVGFVSAYRPPLKNEVLFVWQVGVSPVARGRGLARRMILTILRRDACRGVHLVESTVTPDNTASQKLFHSIARELHTELDVSDYFPEGLFPDEEEAKTEQLHRIGPFDRHSVAERRADDTAIFMRSESAVRSYCRSFPTVFDEARGHRLIDEDGRDYIDFFAGAGVLNYGHNNSKLQSALIGYIQRGGVTHALDMYTSVKRSFLEAIVEILLEPRNLDYRIMFPGPTGTNAVEAAVKLARKVTGRKTVVSFTDGFHGMTLGALALTGNARKRAGAGIPLGFCDRMPFDGYLGDQIDTIDVFERFLDDTSSGVDAPAAVIVETVQAEGGVKLASFEWLRRLEALCRRHDILLIVDDIQVGCGRTGPFFSFEPAGIEPDMITLSKSLSGYGLPLALTLIRPDLDVWSPAEHNGTFRGHNLAMLTATVALEDYWKNDRLSREVEDKGRIVRERLEQLSDQYDCVRDVRGRGLILGLELAGDGAGRLSRACFDRGLIVETSGPRGEVLKLLPPLTIDREALRKGTEIIADALSAVAGDIEA